jgi:hypothetical protein
MHGLIKLCIDVEHEPAEIGQTGWLGDAGTSNEKNLATCMCKKKSFGNSRKTRP